MKSHRSGLFFTLVCLVLVAGCNESTSPTENSGIPRGAWEGEYGFSLNGEPYDSGTPYSVGNAALVPFIGQSSPMLRLSMSLFFQLSDGTFGSVQLYVPVLNAQPQTIPISSYLQDSVASASIDYDSVGYWWYESIAGGTITITKFDTINNLVSGTFSFSASQSSPNIPAIIHVTSGYFNDISIGSGAYGQGSITATVNDSAFSSETGGRETVRGSSLLGRLNLSANGQGILQGSEIVIEGIPPVLGTYALNGPRHYSDTTLSFTYWDRFNYEVSTADSTATGQLTITSLDIPNRRISGTFQFSGTDTLGDRVTITSGEIINVQWEP